MDFILQDAHPIEKNHMVSMRICIALPDCILVFKTIAQAKRSPGHEARRRRNEVGPECRSNQARASLCAKPLPRPSEALGTRRGGDETRSAPSAPFQPGTSIPVCETIAEAQTLNPKTQTLNLKLVHCFLEVLLVLA